MKHNYLSKIENNTWSDIQILKTQLPENISVNSLINKGLRVIVDSELQGLTRLRKNSYMNDSTG